LGEGWVELGCWLVGVNYILTTEIDLTNKLILSNLKKESHLTFKLIDSINRVKNPVDKNKINC